MRWAFEALKAYGVGIQLTPGNEPSPGFDACLQRAGIPVRSHHGFDFQHRSVPVWDVDGGCLVRASSVHPPRCGALTSTSFEAWLETHGKREVLETMYPGYWLGNEVELVAAMQRGIQLAVDVSHLWIQRMSGAASEAALKRVMDYEHVIEVHVSHNDGRSDSHRLLELDTYALHWAKERLQDNTCVIYEAYWHRIDGETRARQVDLMLEALS
jgi:hypothetical protein